MNRPTLPSAPSRLALAAALALGAPAAFAQTATTQEQLLQRVVQLARELDGVKAELQQRKDA